MDSAASSVIFRGYKVLSGYNYLHALKAAEYEFHEMELPILL